MFIEVTARRNSEFFWHTVFVCYTYQTSYTALVLSFCMLHYKCLIVYRYSECGVRCKKF